MEDYKKAFTEVYLILLEMPEEFKKNIPIKFIETLKKERDEKYTPNISNILETNNLLPESKAILGLIYRDFICTKEEKENLLQKEKKNIYKDIQYKEDIFNKNEIKNIVKEETSLIEVKESFYKKIIKFFIKMRRR